MKVNYTTKWKVIYSSWKVNYINQRMNDTNWKPMAAFLKNNASKHWEENLNPNREITCKLRYIWSWMFFKRSSFSFNRIFYRCQQKTIQSATKLFSFFFIRRKTNVVSYFCRFHWIVLILVTIFKCKVFKEYYGVCVCQRTDVCFS